jgi:DNA polymerase I-like protein with 3'-5' exonuclease and polymerase domains
MFPPVKTVLLDLRNLMTELPKIMAAVGASDFCGLDIETHDDKRHDGLNRAMNLNEETRKKAGNKRLLFDNQRTTVTGISLYPDGTDTSWYINLAHADVANRVPWSIVEKILRCLPDTAFFISHNAPFELCMLGNSLGFEIENIICTLQMAVSAYGSDEYPWSAFLKADLGAIGKLIPALRRASVHYDSKKDRQFTGELAEIAGKITGKESDAEWSYNGWVDEINYGYDLKKAVLRHFGHQMSTFAETLGDNAHMGQLTGDQVAEYGCDDAVWAVRLFHRLLELMASHCPNAIKAFFETENPMVHAYADMWRQGMKLNLQKVLMRRGMEREAFAVQLRKLKAALRGAEFPTEPDPRLLKHEKWYKTGYAKYRAEIRKWVHSADNTDAYLQAQQVRSPVSNAWATESGDEESSGPNLVHYMRMRTILYDLLRLPLEYSQGKVQSDGDSRGNLLVKAQKAAEIDDDEKSVVGWKTTADIAVEALTILTEMSSIEQRMKLYLTPYTHLIDPDTGCVYSTISSMLDTRRLASTNPNGMQLAKQGESTYVRGFFEADDFNDGEERVVISRDWSGIELVIIGEESKDPEFAKVFGQLPHGDLHSGAAADILSVEVLGLTEKSFKGLKRSVSWDGWFDEYGEVDRKTAGRLLANFRGQPHDPPSSYKFFRGTPIGKGANFNYWYSGWLATIGENMGWDFDQTALAVNRYRERFSVAEQWRLEQIRHGCEHGWVELPDGHRRYRMEATQEWLIHWLRKWPIDDFESQHEGFNGVVHEIARKISKRSHNQLVNSKVQGLCAALMKRTINRLRAAFAAKGWTKRDVRIMIPIHDELVFSVRRKLVHEFLTLTEHIMADHKDLFPTLALDSSPAIGLNFEPWNAIKAPLGQVELYEPPKLIVGDKLADTRLDRDGVDLVLDYLFHSKMKAAA